MRSAGITILSGLMLACALGCGGVASQVASSTPAGEDAAAAKGSECLSPPQMEGRVFRVWRFQNGELMALLGWKDGLCKGDILLLTRGGDQINVIEVLDVGEETFFGRVFERGVPELLPRVGDFAARTPQLDEPIVTAP